MQVRVVGVGWLIAVRLDRVVFFSRTDVLEL